MPSSIHPILLALEIRNVFDAINVDKFDWVQIVARKEVFTRSTGVNIVFQLNLHLRKTHADTRIRGYPCARQAILQTYLIQWLDIPAAYLCKAVLKPLRFDAMAGHPFVRQWSPLLRICLAMS
jgi:hypothetical protein